MAGAEIGQTVQLVALAGRAQGTREAFVVGVHDQHQIEVDEVLPAQLAGAVGAQVDAALCRVPLRARIGRRAQMAVVRAGGIDLDALARLDAALTRHADDPRLVAVGEIGLDHFVPELTEGPLRERQERFFREQLKLARRHGLPVILHLRRAVDAVLKGLREIGVAGGIAHAFSGSRQQADALLELGVWLGFGGAMTYERASRLRALAAELPADAIVMETDAPDIPPHWLYTRAEQRAAGRPQGRNQPAELPRIGAELARLRGLAPPEWAAITRANAQAALPRLARLPRRHPATGAGAVPAHDPENP